MKSFKTDASRKLSNYSDSCYNILIINEIPLVLMAIPTINSSLAIQVSFLDIFEVMNSQKEMNVRSALIGAEEVLELVGP